MIDEKFPLIDLRGTHKEIGQLHGELLSERINQTIEYYHSIFDKPEDVIFEQSSHFKRVIGEFNPKYQMEIEAIAEAAQVDPLWIYALNSRSEILTKIVSECTAVYSASHKLLSQNWDWAKSLEELAVVLRIQYDNGHRILMMTEPGIIGKIGLNSSGIGVCLNFLHVDKPLGGLPIHVILRAILDCSSMLEARKLVEQNHSGKSGNILMGTAKGELLNYEFAGDEYYEFSSSDNFTHTNHFLANSALNINKEKLASSKARYFRSQELIAKEKLDFNEVKSLLGDRKDTNLPICRPYLPDLDIGELGTVCSIIMDLVQLNMHLTRGNPFDHDYEKIELM